MGGESVRRKGSLLDLKVVPGWEVTGATRPAFRAGGGWKAHLASRISPFCAPLPAPCTYMAWITVKISITVLGDFLPTGVDMVRKNDLKHLLQQGKCQAPLPALLHPHRACLSPAAASPRP